MATDRLQTLIDYANYHDCGVAPTAVLNPDRASITVRVATVDGAGNEGTEQTVCRTLREVREALGY